MDKRSIGYKRRKLSTEKGTSAMLTLLEAAKKVAIPAKYVLFDSCFFLSTISLATYFFISFLCHIVIYAFILLDQLFIANGIHRIPIKTGIVISRYGDQISFPKILKVLVLKISVELPTNGIKSNAFCIP